MSERIQGKVKWFDIKRGYGFILKNRNNENNQDADRDIFVYYKDIKAEGFRKLYQDDIVEYTLVETERGPKAVDVVLKKRLSRRYQKRTNQAQESENRQKDNA